MTMCSIVCEKVMAFRRLPVDLKQMFRFLSITTLLILSTNWTYGKGGRTTVENTVTVNGSEIHGIMTISNERSKPVTITSIEDALDVRYPNGTVPMLPPGYKEGYYRVVLISLPTPASPIPPGAEISIPYVIDTCSPAVAHYFGAKDMRSVSVVQVAKGRVRQGRTPNFNSPNQNDCSVCGNGTIEDGEECDGGGCCTETCEFIENGTECDDGNTCTQSDACFDGVCIGADPIVCSAPDQCHEAGTCNPATGGCSTPTSLSGTLCDDGNPCSTGDTCQSGTCSGHPIICDDGNECTTDHCAGGECVFENNTNSCEDGSICTADDVCVDGTCQSGSGLDCNDLKACTDDVCVEGIGCTHEPSEICDDCNADECILCKEECSLVRTECVNTCWENFSTCLAGCTTTYCAPFCQVGLGNCLDACPDDIVCWEDCEIDNGCLEDCL